eukprot:c8321_g1_i1 orf=52-270(-)
MAAVTAGISLSSGLASSSWELCPKFVGLKDRMIRVTPSNLEHFNPSLPYWFAVLHQALIPRFSEQLHMDRMH